MINRFFAGVTAFCIGLTCLPTAALAADSGAQDRAMQYYSDVSDIIGPIRPPSTGQGEDDQTEGEEVKLPNTEEFQSNLDFKPYDPGYPEKEQYGNYWLRIPDLKERLTFSTGNKNQLVGTLFAPGVSKSKGWKDATKKWGKYDSGLCFAASSSNLISWYLERYKSLHPEDTKEYETHPERIFDRFRNGWDTAEGGDQKEALSWYFTGGFPSRNPHPNGSQLTGKEPGGYLLNLLPNNTSDRWSQISFDWKPQEVFFVYGSFEDNRFPYIEDVGGVSPGLAFSTLESFSKQVLRQLHYGPCTISIITDNAGGGSGHAITLWGVDYDVESGLITHIHVTDSDDTSSKGLFTVRIESGRNNDGVRLIDYPYHPPAGMPMKFTRIRDSILLYAPDVVSSVRSYTGPRAEIQALHSDPDGRGVDVQVSNISRHALEYGYSYDINPDNVIQWQSDSHFSGLEPDQYYFFARVKETSDHAAGGTSEPKPYRVMTPSPASQEAVASLGLGMSVFRPYNGIHQYIWYGTEKGSDGTGSAQPILWRVLDTETNDHVKGLFLISDKLYGTGKDGGLNFSPSGNDYQSSLARLWCQSFENANLAPWEREAIRMTTKTDAPYSTGVEFAGYQNILSNDRLFLPSAEEICREEYGFGTEKDRQGRYRANSFAYWLRSSVLNESGSAGYVDGAGNVTTQSITNNYAARPAFNLDESQVLYAAAVGNGQFSDNLGLQRIQTVQSRDFRLVLKDTSRDFRVTSSEISLEPGEQVTLNYQGAKTNSSNNEYISALLMDSKGTTPIYYGKVALVQNENGSVSFKLPKELVDGTYMLKVFNEQYNGERESGRSSAFSDVSLTIQKQTPVAEVNLTVPAPVTGKKPQNAQAGEDGYTVENTTWTPGNDVFLGNTSYSVSIVIKPKAGHIITDGTAFSLNGEPVNALKNGEAYIITYDEFKKTEPERPEPPVTKPEPPAPPAPPKPPVTEPKPPKPTAPNPVPPAPPAPPAPPKPPVTKPEPSVTYTVTFVTNGGSAVAPVSARRGATVELSGYVPTRANHVFAGWYADASLTRKVSAVTLTENTTVYAKWTEVVMDNPFADVDGSDYFYKPVLWAVGKGVTAGVSPNRFGPGETCTRGQIVTFLWSAAGKPKPQSTHNPFDDVSPSDYYHQAVLWAVENNITAGVSPRAFGPDQSCTRAQAVTFLWSAMGKPQVSGGAAFGDVSGSDYYYRAVQWAVDNGITAGVGNNLFAPGDVCTRGQIVTFLYKAYN